MIWDQDKGLDWAVWSGCQMQNVRSEAFEWIEKIAQGFTSECFICENDWE